MTCLGCNLIEQFPVVLEGGRTVCTNCRDFAFECEVRRIAAMATNAERAAFLALLSEKQGPEAAAKLRAAVWKKLKETA